MQEMAIKSPEGYLRMFQLLKGQLLTEKAEGEGV
jgi:hypothetical protein